MMVDPLFVNNAPAIWMIAGALFLALEAFMLPGVGLLFAGLGAISVGLMIAAGLLLPEHLIPQFAWFFAATTIWTIVLWKPMKRFRIGTNKPYKNIVGDRAIVDGQPLETGKTGTVKWSGTTMNARIAEENVQTLAIPVGSEVEIVEISGSVLLVKPIH